ASRPEPRLWICCRSCVPPQFRRTVTRAMRRGKTHHWIDAGSLLSSVEFAGGVTMTKVAVIGAGLIGRSWSIVFARAGFQVNLWDPFPHQIEAAMAFIADRLPELRQAGLLADAPADVLARIAPVATLSDAVQDVVHVQENGPEQVPAKQALFAELDRI